MPGVLGLGMHLRAIDERHEGDGTGQAYLILHDEEE